MGFPPGAGVSTLWLRDSMLGMHLHKDWPYLAGFGIAAASVAGAAAYLLGGGGQLTLATATAVGATVLGQLALLGLTLQQDERQSVRIKRVMRDQSLFQDEARARADALQTTVAQFMSHDESRSHAVMSGISELRTNYLDLQGALVSGLANVVAQAPQPQAMPMEDFEAFEEMAEPLAPEMEAELPQNDFEDEELGDKIFFALEPVIDIPSRRTAHYRLNLSLEMGGEELASDRLLHYASRVGKRQALDLIAAREALQLLAKLRLRDPDLNIFMDIGAETLADPQALARLIVARQDAGGSAQGLVFEMPHAALAGLSERALEGLAALAREGVHFALANVSVAALDLQAMNMLNVRHVGVAAGSIDADEGPSTGLVGFAQVARLSRISVIVTGLTNAALVAKLASVTRLACGPCFALPRRVKRHAASADSMPSLNIAA